MKLAPPPVVRLPKKSRGALCRGPAPVSPFPATRADASLESQLEASLRAVGAGWRARRPENREVRA